MPQRSLISGRWLAAGLAVAGVVALGLGLSRAETRSAGDAGASTPVPSVRTDPVPVSSLSFDTASAVAATLPRMRSLLVSVDGQVRLEQYFNGATAARTTNIKSASKSIIATLVGIALERGQ